MISIIQFVTNIEKSKLLQLSKARTESYKHGGKKTTTIKVSILAN